MNTLYRFIEGEPQKPPYDESIFAKIDAIERGPEGAESFDVSHETDIFAKIDAIENETDFSDEKLYETAIRSAKDWYAETDLSGGAKTFAGQMPSMVTDVIPETLGRAIRRGDVNLDESALDKWIQKNTEERERAKTLTPEEREQTWFRVPFTDIKVTKGHAEDAADSIGYSIVNAATTFGAKAATTAVLAPVLTPIGSKIAGVGAGFVGGTAISQGATKDQFIDMVKNEFLNYHKGEKMTPELQNQWSEIYNEIEGDADWYGFWEAAPETVGNLLMLGIGKMGKGAVASKVLSPIKKKIANKVGVKIATKVGVPPAKLAAMLTEESITEMVTQKKQADVEYKNGLREKPLTYSEALEEVLPMVLTTTPVMGGGIASGAKIAGRIAAKKDVFDKIEAIEEGGEEDTFASIRKEYEAGDLTKEDLEGIKQVLVNEPEKVSQIDSILKEVEPKKKIEFEQAEKATPEQKKVAKAMDDLGKRAFGETFETGKVKIVPDVKEAENIQQVADALKMGKVYFYDAGNTQLSMANGVYDNKTGNIFINRNAERPFLTVLGHESLHKLRREAPELYTSLGPVLNKKAIGFKEYVDRLNKKREAAGLPEIEKSKAAEEFVADFVAESVSKPDFWKKLHQENPTLSLKLAQILTDLIKKIKATLKTRGEFFKDLDAAESAIAKIYAEFKKEPSEAAEAIEKETLPTTPKPEKVAETTPQAKPTVEFKSTLEAVEFGKKASKEEIAELKKLNEKALEEQKAKLQESSDIGTKAQFYNEAIQAAEGRDFEKKPTKKAEVPEKEEKKPKEPEKTKEIVEPPASEEAGKLAEAKKEPETPKEKEPWEMTLSEYESVHGKPRKGATSYTENTFHKNAVHTAINQGKPVHEEVLKDYPDLQKTPSPKKKKKEKIPGTKAEKTVEPPSTEKAKKPEEKATSKRTPSLKLAEWVSDRVMSGVNTTWRDLFKQADIFFKGTQAEGVYVGKDAYDAMELGINMAILKSQSQFTEDVETAVRDVQILKQFLTLVPTQTKRTKEQQEFQQFSTPPPLAYVANWTANIVKDEVYIEPSAGIGGLALFGKIAGAKVVVNELSPRRSILLDLLGFKDRYQEDAEQLDNILPENVKPTVIVMNPPFSATAGRLETNQTKYGARHVEQALNRLEPNGRLVAIVGKGMAMDAPAFKGWWKKIKSEYGVRANIRVSGKEYGKYGTTFDNRLLVIDKTEKKDYTIVKGKVENVEDLPALLKEVRNDRHIHKTKQTPDEPARRKTSEKSEGIPTVATPTHRPAIELGGGKPESGIGQRPPVQPAIPDRPSTRTREPGKRAETSGTGRNVETRKSSGTSRRSSNETGRADGRKSTLKVTSTEKIERKKEISDSLYENYVSKTKVKGAQPHPSPLVESAAMADTTSPKTDYIPNIPAKTVKSGNISEAQLEQAVYAGMSHSKILPNGERRGYFIGDGTGVGKGREVSAIIWDNWNRGRKKAIWLSENFKLAEDAYRDLKGAGWQEGADKLFKWNQTKLGKNIANEEGILFGTYNTLGHRFKKIREDKPETLKDMTIRINQIVDWFGKDYDGVIIFDESHNMGNAVATRGTRGMKKPAQKAIAGVLLQKLLPKARVVYSSATGATEVNNLTYARRLGLWGKGTSFGTARKFIGEVESGGLMGMELLARDMKTQGNYLARTLSYDGVEYERLEHKLTNGQRKMYDVLSSAWQKVLHNIHAAVEETQQQKTKWSAFWGAHQRFFQAVVISMQTPSVIKDAEKQLKSGNSVVIQLTSTGEAQQERVLAQMEEGQDYEDLDFTPRENLINYLKKSFPVQQYEEFIDEEGERRSRPVYDSNDQPVLNKQAVARRDKLIAEVATIKVPASPLDMIVEQLGPKNVAEVTGRSRRLTRNKDGELKLQRRSNAIIKAEIQDFEDDKRRTLIFSEKGGTGASYHADKSLKNQRKRVHYLLQPGWRADKAVQGLGRSHRSNQAQTPKFILVSTDLEGQKRFLSTIARRLDQLGSLTKGQRQTGSQGIFQARDNLENDYARRALVKTFEDLDDGKIEDLDTETYKRQTGLSLRDKDKNFTPPNIRQFLNRLLSMNIPYQNSIFSYFSKNLDSIVQAEAEAGTLDVGIETITGIDVKKMKDQIIHTDQETGANTRYIHIDVTNETKKFTFEESKDIFYKDSGIPEYIKNLRSGRVWVISDVHNRTKRDGTVEEYRRLKSPNYYVSQGIAESVIKDKEKWKKVSPAQAKKLWNAEYKKLPETTTDKIHMITGAILPVWDRLAGETRIYRTQTNEGERLLGRVIPEEILEATLKNFGVGIEKVKMTGKEIAQQVVDFGSKVRLSNGWRIKRSRVSDEYRIELTGPSWGDTKEVKDLGVFDEIIGYQTRYFIPNNNAAKIIDEIVKYRDIISYKQGYTGANVEDAPKFSLKDKQPVWYSKMEQVLEKKLPMKAKPEVMSRAISAFANKGQFKKEELDWSGVIEWLGEQGKVKEWTVKKGAHNFIIKEIDGRYYTSDPDFGVAGQATSNPTLEAARASALLAISEREGKEIKGASIEEVPPGKVTKQQVLDYLKENNVQIREVVKGKNVLFKETGKNKWEYKGSNVSYRIRKRQTDLGKEYNEYYYSLYEGKGPSWVQLGDFDSFGEATDFLVSEYDSDLEDATKFSQYTEPGGENYKEVLLTLPTREEGRYNLVESKTDRIVKSFKNYDAAFEHMNSKGFNDLSIKEKTSYHIAPAKQTTEYTGGHWEEPNVLAHLRLNERIDTEGNKVMFLEELQSDWHQSGRKKGYGKAKAKKLPNGNWTIELPDGSTYGEYSTKLGAEESPTASLKGVPDAPFKKSWPMLAFKRAVRMAAEGGFDKIGWTPGEIQAERYNLSKQIDELEVYQNEDGKYTIMAKKGGNTLLDEAYLSENELENYVGKDLAEKIVKSSIPKDNNTPKVFKGIDLKIGGEGMVAFYDRMLVNEVNKFFNKKKWGKAKVGVGKIGTSGLEYQALDAGKYSLGVFKTRGEAEKIVAAYSEKDGEKGEVVVKVVSPSGWAIKRRSGPANITNKYEVLDEDGYVNGMGRTEEEAFENAMLEVGKSIGAYKPMETWTLPITPEIKQKALREGMPMFMVKAYHGSPHAFDKFSTEKIGTGEGAQAFGWGLYFTDQEDIARHYTKLGEGYKQFKFDGITSKSLYDALSNYQREVLKNLANKGKKAAIENAMGFRSYEQSLNYDKGVKAMDNLIQDIKNDKITVNPVRNLYKVTLHKGKKPGEYEWLEWDKPISQQNLNKIIQQLKKEDPSAAKADPYFNERMKRIYQRNGQHVYRGLASNFGSGKEASLFLLRAGIDGIKYPTGTLSGIKGSDKFNYVVFDENVVEVEKHERFSLKDKKPELSPLAQKYLKKLQADVPHKEIHKEADGLFKWARKQFGTGFVDKDMKWYHRTFSNPYWLGKKFKSMARAIGIEINASEIRSSILFDDYAGDLGKLQDDYKKWSKSDKKELEDLIWKMDGKRISKKFVPTDWHKPMEAGKDIQINPEHYAEVRKYLLEMDVTPKVVDGFLTIRKKLDEKYVDIDQTMRVESLDPALITEYRAEIRKINNYFPHRRTGNAYVQVINKATGDVVYREHYNSWTDRARGISKKAPARAENWLKTAIKSNQLKGKLSDYKVLKPQPLKEMPDEVFFQIPIENIQQVVTRAGRSLETSRVKYEADRLFNKEGRSRKEALKLARQRLSADMEDALSKAVADTFKARGWGKHGIHRKGIPGHETEDIFGILFDYLSGYAGFKTKIERTKLHHKNLVEIDAGKNPNEYRHLSKYVKDMLANQDRTDRSVDTLRGLFFVKYLGGVVKSGMVNLTQNVVMAMPILSTHTKKAHRKLEKAMIDTRKALTSKAAWTGKQIPYTNLTPNEQRALNEMGEAGTTMDLYLRELKGNMPGVGKARIFKKALDKAGIFMQVAERFNRASTGLAAYRVGVKEKNMTHAEAVEFAKQIVYDSHFLYGKANMPTSMRGEGKWLRAGYTFRSFSHNYILAMSHLLTNQGIEGKKAFARALRNIFLMGGLTSVPFFKAFSEALMWAMGDEDEDLITKARAGLPKDWMKDMATYGLPGVAGIDLTGSLSIEVPRNWKEVVGVPYAILEDSMNTYKSLKSGAYFRAVSELPITPIVARNAMRGLELYVRGHRTRSGRDINVIGEEGPRKITLKEAVQKAGFGLQPTSVSKGYASYSAIRKMKQSMADKKKSLADRYVNADRRGDEIEKNRIMQEIEAWNKKARKEGKNHRIIDIERMIKSRMHPAAGVPKIMLREATRIQQQWK